MGKKVFANMMEIAAKKSSNKVIAAMPNVCLSPPSPPAGPIPIPYPMFGAASDTADGSKKVKIGGKPAMLKDKSNFKKSKGDEAATKSFGQGLVTKSGGGPVHHVAYSFDVKFEGKNVCRMGDMMGGNHGSPMANTLDPGADIGEFAASQPVSDDCEDLSSENDGARSDDVRPSYKNKPYTLTTAKRSGRGGVMKSAAPNEMIRSGVRDKYQPTNNTSTISSNSPLNRNHTEPKLLEPEYKKGGTMKMKIHHRFEEKGGIKSDSMPCPTCKETICKAQKEGMNIVLCNEDNKEIPAEKLCDNGKPKPEETWKAAGL